MASVLLGVSCTWLRTQVRTRVCPMTGVARRRDRQYLLLHTRYWYFNLCSWYRYQVLYCTVLCTWERYVGWVPGKGVLIDPYYCNPVYVVEVRTRTYLTREVVFPGGRCDILLQQKMMSQITKLKKRSSAAVLHFLLTAVGRPASDISL